MQLPSQEAVTQDAQAIVNPIVNQLATSNINSCVNAIKATRDKLNAMLLKEGITDAEKDQINKLLDKLTAIEDEIKEITENQNKYTPGEALEKSREAQNKLRELVNEASQIGTTGATDATGTGTETENATGTATETGASTETQGATANNKKVARIIADNFHDAVTYLWGTDDEKFDAVCEALDEDNIIDTMNQYKSSYGNSFMEDFMWDADYDQKRTYGKQIARILRDKATELGIMDKCEDDFAKIFKELDCKFWINNDIFQEFDNVVAKITKAQRAQE